MEVREGCKQTEVHIPKDWQVKKLGEIAEIRTGSKDVNEGNPNGEFPFFTCSREHTHCDSYSFEGEAILVAGNGEVGSLHYYDGRFEAYQRTYVLQRFQISARYVWYQLNAFLKPSLGIGTIGSSIPYIKRENLHDYALVSPSDPEEQAAIAAALSDTDALISSLEKLIAKKRDVKKGTMQMLLTGKKRLPGFSGEWRVENVRDFGEVITGSTPSTGVNSYWNGDIPWATPTDIRTRDILQTERQITHLGLDAVRKLTHDSVLVTCIASIGKNAILRTDGACNQQINAVIPDEQHSSEFLYYLFEGSKQYLLGHAGITATNIISKSAFSEIVFAVPLLSEQTAIAEVLSDMDTELEALERKLEKHRSIKQGMMQELLTGRKRLICEN